MVELSIKDKEFFYFDDIEELRATEAYLLGVHGGYQEKDIKTKPIDALPDGQKVSVWADVI